MVMVKRSRIGILIITDAKHHHDDRKTDGHKKGEKNHVNNLLAAGY